MRSEFEQVDAAIRALGASLVNIGGALLYRPEDVYVRSPDENSPPGPDEKASLGIADPLPTKEEISDLLNRWRALKPNWK